MQTELVEEGKNLSIQILGINEVGEERENEAMYAGRSLPWLQETTEQRVWEDWDVTYRDVIILDAENKPHAVFNVTIHDLSKAVNYDSLKALLLEAAE
jgi:hypothetical protein